MKKLTLLILILFLVICLSACDPYAVMEKYPFDVSDCWYCEDLDFTISYGRTDNGVPIISSYLLKWNGSEIYVVVRHHVSYFSMDIDNGDGIISEDENIATGSWRYDGDNLVYYIETDNFFDGEFDTLVFVPVEEPNTPLTTSTEPITQEPWYSKMKIEYDTTWSFPVVETKDSFYYITEQGIFRHEKATGTDILLVRETVYGLLLRDNLLYFNTGHEIKSLDTDTLQISVLWAEAMLQASPEAAEGYLEISDFLVQNGYLYIAITGTSAIRVSMETGETDLFLEDYSLAVISGDKCYYTDHAQRTFSIYCIESAGISLVRGEGISEPGADVTRIDNIVMANGSIYYCVRDLSDLYRLDPSGQDELIFDGDDGVQLCSVGRCTSGSLYFYTTDGTQMDLYVYRPLTGTELLLSAEHKARLCDISVSESAVFYKTSEDAAVQMLEVE